MTSERYLQRFLVGAKMRIWSGRVGKLPNATDLGMAVGDGGAIPTATDPSVVTPPIGDLPTVVYKNGIWIAFYHGIISSENGTN